MSYAWFIGVVTGTLIVAAAAAVGLLTRRMRGAVEYDERTDLMFARAGAVAFYLLAGFVYLAWLVDNLIAYRQGQPPRVVSPWSAMLLAMAVLYKLSLAYQKWRLSHPAELDHQERRRTRLRAAVLLLSVPAVGTSASMAFSHNQAALGWFLTAYMGAALIAGAALLVRTVRLRV